MGNLLLIDMGTRSLTKIIYWVVPNIHDYFNGVWFPFIPEPHKHSVIAEATLWNKLHTVYQTIIKSNINIYFYKPQRVFNLALTLIFCFPFIKLAGHVSQKFLYLSLSWLHFYSYLSLLIAMLSQIILLWIQCRIRIFNINFWEFLDPASSITAQCSAGI